MKQLVIYRIFHIETNKSYIGKCSRGLKRIDEHFRDYKNPKKEYRAKLLYRAMNKYGANEFDWTILYMASDLKDLDAKEIEFIQQYKSNNQIFGYNLTKGGDGGNTWNKLASKERSAASKKLSKSLKRAHKNNPSLAEDSAERLRQIRKDPIKSAKNNEINSKRMIKMNATDSRFIGANKRKVICVENGKIYNSIKEAALEFGIKPATMRWRIDNNKNINGFTIKHVKVEK